MSPEFVVGAIRDWVSRGLGIEDHQRRPNVRVTGVSRGKARFVLGGGVSVFVVLELGKLPEGVQVLGKPVGGKVVAFGVNLYGVGAGYRTSMHVFPAEYLADPPLPGLPDGLAYDVLYDLLAPPPIFSRGLTVIGSPSYVYARVNNDVSRLEAREGGGGGLGGVLVRGRSYLRLLGVPQGGRSG
jgi:hypothetical protein